MPLTTSPKFRRPLYYKLGRSSHGRDVLAVERCLHRTGYRHAEASLDYGWRARDNVELFQRRHNMNNTGVYNEQTHSKLAVDFDDYEKWLYRNPLPGDVKPAQPTAVDRLMRAAWYLYAKRPWAYHAVRPFILYDYGQRIGYAFDCSWFVTNIFFLAGQDDPNGLGYHGGAGNTGSLWAHGRDVTGQTPKPGDLLFYGFEGSWSDPRHTAICCNEFGTRGMGFGSSGGPRVLSTGYRTLRGVRRYV